MISQNITTESTNQNGKESVKASGHICGIDGLKGICALFIAFIWHYQLFGPLVSSYAGYDYLPPLYDFAGYFCELFFILSGFGLMIGYGKRISNGGMTFVQFMLGRLKKIYPLYFLSIMVTLVVELALHHYFGMFFATNVTVSNLINDLLLIGHVIDGETVINSSLWFIPVIFLCYVVFYFILRFSKGTESTFLISMAVIVVGIVLLILRCDLPFMNNSVARGLMSFPVGIIIAIMYNNRDRIDMRKIVFVSFIILLSITALVKYDGYLHLGNWTLIAALAVMPSIVIVSVFFPPLSRILDIRPLRFLGSISMGIYFFHFPIECAIRFIDYWFALSIDYNSGSVWVLYVIITLLVSVLYKYVGHHYERAFLSLTDFRKSDGLSRN